MFLHTSFDSGVSALTKVGILDTSCTCLAHAGKDLSFNRLLSIIQFNFNFKKVLFSKKGKKRTQELI